MCLVHVARVFRPSVSLHVCLVHVSLAFPQLKVLYVIFSHAVAQCAVYHFLCCSSSKCHFLCFISSKYHFLCCSSSKCHSLAALHTECAAENEQQDAGGGKEGDESKPPDVCPALLYWHEMRLLRSCCTQDMETWGVI